MSVPVILDCISDKFNLLAFTEAVLVFLSVKISVATFIVAQLLKFIHSSLARQPLVGPGLLRSFAHSSLLRSTFFQFLTPNILIS